jgi:hypothetical protein
MSIKSTPLTRQTASSVNLIIIWRGNPSDKWRARPLAQRVSEMADDQIGAGSFRLVSNGDYSNYVSLSSKASGFTLS